MPCGLEQHSIIIGYRLTVDQLLKFDCPIPAFTLLIIINIVILI
jgi:hypothetical protein